MNELLTDRLTYYESEAGRLRRENMRLRGENTRLRSGKWVSIVLFIGSAFMLVLTAAQLAQ